MTTKFTFQKAYIIFLGFLGIIIAAILGYTLTGYFTSKHDDKMYISYIKNDISTMNSDLNNEIIKKIKKLVSNGALFLTYSGEEERIIVKKSSSTSFPKILKAIYDEEKISSFLDVLDRNEMFSVDRETLDKAEIMEPSGLFASFGDTFSFRLLLAMRKILDAIKELTIYTNVEKNSYLSILIDNNSLLLTLFEESSGKDDFFVSRVEYYIPVYEGRPEMKNIMEHAFYRLFCV